MQAAPASLACKEKCTYARKQQQGSQINRHSLRDGLRLIRGLLGVPGFLATVACKIACELDPSVGGPEHHDFAVRLPIARQSIRMRPSHPAARFVTIAKRPLCARRPTQCI
jgi:hypothetical protein